MTDIGTQKEKHVVITRLPLLNVMFSGGSCVQMNCDFI